MSNLQEVFLQNINDDFCYISYKGFDNIIMMKENRYINATKACIDRNRIFNRLLENDEFISLMSTLNILIERFDTPYMVYDNENDEYNEVVQGIYIHPLLIHIFFEWLCSTQLDQTIDFDTE